MKLLAVLFLVGLALASAIPAPSHELSRDDADDFDRLLDFTLEAEGDDEIQTELGKKLRERLNGLLEKIKEAIEHGKDIKQNILDQLKETRNQMKDLKVDLGEKAKELLGKIKDKAKDYWNKILEKLRPDGSSRLEERFIWDGILTKGMNKTLFNLLDTIVKNALDFGQNASEHSMKLVKELMDKLHFLGMDIREKVRSFLNESLKEHPEILKNILKVLGLDKHDTAFAEEKERFIFGILTDRMNKTVFDTLNLIVKDALDFGKNASEHSMKLVKEIMDKLNLLGMDIHEKVRNFLNEALKEHPEILKNILKALGLYKHDTAFAEEKGDDEIQTELGKKLRERLNGLLEKIKEAIEHGKDIKQNILDQLKETRNQMKDLKVDLGEKAKELLGKIKDKAKDYWSKILEKLRPDGSSRLEERDIFDDLKKTLSDACDKLMEDMKNAMDKGKEVNDKMINKMKELIRKLRAFGVDIREKVRTKLAEFVQDPGILKTLFEKFGIGEQDTAFAVEEPQTELGKRLKKEFEDILEKLKDSFEKGKELKDSHLEKLKEIRQQLKDLKVDIGEKAKDLLRNLKEKAKDYWQRILDKLRPGSRRSVQEFAEGEDDEPKTELGKKLRENLDELLAKIKDAIDHGKGVKEDYIEKVKQIRDKLKELKENIGTKAKELLQKIKEGGKDYIKKILDLFNAGKRALEAEEETKEEIAKTLRDHLDELLEKIKDAVEHGKKVKDQYLEKVKDMRQKLKDMGKDIGEKAKELISDIKEKGKDYLKKLLERLGLSKRSIAMYTEELAADDDTDDVVNFREKIGVLLKMIEDAIENDEELNMDDMNEIIRQGDEQYKKLENKGIKLGEKENDLIKQIVQKFKDYFWKQQEKIGKKQERSIAGLKDKLKQLRDKIEEKFDVNAIKEKIESILGKDNEIGKFLINLVTEKGEKAKQRILDIIDRILGKDQEDKRSIKDLYEKLREYLKNMKIELKEKFSKFGEWAVAQYEKGLEKGKDRAENLKKLAKEFINNAKNMSRDVIEEAKEFFKEYKDDLGIVYKDVVDKIKDIVKS